MKTLILGSSGYIGSHLCKYFDKNELILDTRNKYNVSSDRIFIDFNIEIAKNLDRNIKNIIYLIYTHLDTEYEFVEKLLKYCKKKNINFYFISSQSIFHKTKSPYAISKFKISELVKNYNQFVIYLPFVYGGLHKGLYGKFIKLMNRAYIKPLIFPSPNLQIVFINDVCVALFQFIKNSYNKECFICNPDPVPFNLFVQKLSIHSSKNILNLPLPIPKHFIILLSMLFKHNQYIFSLMNLINVEQVFFKREKIYNIHYHNLDDSLVSLNSHRRLKLILAKKYLNYFLKSAPSPSSIKHFVKGINNEASIKQSYKNLLLLYFLPVSLIDHLPKIIKTKFSIDKFLYLASRISEFTREGAILYLSDKNTGPLRLFFLIVSFCSYFIYTLLSLFVIPVIFLIYEK